MDSIPLPLQPVLGEIRADTRTSLTHSWYRDNQQRWLLGFKILLSAKPSEFMPEETSWFLVVEEKIGDARITVFPATDGGITSTFPHQSANLPGPPGSLWRLGNPCLERPGAAFGRDLASGEPIELAERLVWHLHRLLGWVDAAVAGTLLGPNDHVELPSLGIWSGTIMGFTENIEDLKLWLPLIGTWGYAVTGALNGAMKHRQVIKYFKSNGELVKRDYTGPGDDNLPVDTVWIMLSQLPILEPWQAPRNWQELSACLERDSVSLKEIFDRVGRDTRSTRKNSITRLLVGAPFSEKGGTAAGRIHWIGAEQIGLSGADSKRNGFRPVEKNRIQWDVAKASSAERIRWMKTANWASDQLRTRGQAERKVCLSRILLIGAGAIGSALIENLARLGISEIGVIDGDTLEVGNLSRHTLGISDCGHLKADALASRLNNCGPDIVSIAHPGTFPPSDSSVSDRLRQYDAIIDCTGSDSVLRALSAFDWRTEKLFVSLSISWGAREFFCFSASEVSFPSIDALGRFSQGMTIRPSIESANREGIGCWHPVFPADADDIQLWSAIGSRFVRRAIIERTRMCKIFRLSDDSTVTVTNV
ncbi:HesA/MoeB/ThiF family protein [Brucella anthropi]|uniref:HesA/MoeB/ThiF family protein n=1 Tax=Brucella anthropi TaxID=529 RepID=UPI000287B619|nr:ThiF family adenylyltransferase [Brucella anthropi]